MINVRAIYLGNEAEAYILDDFIDGINIINSDDNHVGKTIVMQSIMFAMGSEAMFPHNFKPKEYVFIIDLDVDGEAISILRSRDTFAIKNVMSSYLKKASEILMSSGATTFVLCLQ